MTSPGAHARGDRVIDVVAAQVPACPRCGGEGLLAARVPHCVERPDGHLVRGTAQVVLCPSCDAGDPAGGLITFFHVHGQVDADTLTQCAELIQAWVASIRILPPDLQQLDAEVEAWYRGDL